MIKAVGADCAKKLKQRLVELEAAPNMTDIPAHARCHPLFGKRKGQYAVYLVHPYRLIFEPDCDPLPCKTDGGLDLSKVNKILVKRIIDYH